MNTPKRETKSADIVVIGSGETTLDEYHGFCDKGHDDLFAKDPKYLRPLKGPTFLPFVVGGFFCPLSAV